MVKLKDGFIPNELNKVVTLGKRIKVANKEKKSKNTIKIRGYVIWATNFFFIEYISLYIFKLFLIASEMVERIEKKVKNSMNKGGR